MASPYTVHIDQAVLDDLQERLGRTRLPDHLQGSRWDYGTESSYLQELLQYWKTTYDWRKEEQILNKTMHHFTIPLNAMYLHFIHEKSKHKNAIPLLITHGWPGSFLEFTEIIPQLVNPGEGKQAFHVVAPSLPGYGFSSAPKHKGFALVSIAKTFNQLMLELGYTKYVAQGGDWGSAVSKALGIFHSENCRGIHVNFMIASPNRCNPWHLLQLANAFVPYADQFPLFLSADEIKGIKGLGHFQSQESGYSQVQSTKPQSLGYSLNDSPVGLLAWMVEKFRTWSDRRHTNGQLPFSKDFLITNCCLYWLTGNVTSSFRLYYEARHAHEGRQIKQYCKAPTGVAVFPEEICGMPKNWAKGFYNIQQWTVMKKGGHFAAKEEPEALANDVQKFFGNKALFGKDFASQ